MLSYKFTIGLLVVLTIYHLTSCIYMSREILAWVPDNKRRIKLLLMLWFIPIFGINMTNIKGKLGLFQESRENGPPATSGGILEIENALNPGAKYRVEVIAEQKAEVPSTISEQDDLPQTLSAKPKKAESKHS